MKKDELTRKEECNHEESKISIYENSQSQGIHERSRGYS